VTRIGAEVALQKKLYAVRVLVWKVGANKEKFFNWRNSLRAKERSPLEGLEDFVQTLNLNSFLARDAFIRTNRRSIPIMFVHLSVCLGRARIVNLWSYGARQRKFKFMVR